MKHRIRISILFLSLLLFCSCAEKADQTQSMPTNSQPEIEYGHFPQDFEPLDLMEETQDYKIYGDGKDNYLYRIFDADGTIVKTEQCGRCPEIEKQGNNRLAISLQAGTGIETRWTYYYNIESGVVSDVFYGVLEQVDDTIVYISDYDTITVRDIFDETRLLYSFNDFKELSANCVTPFVGAEFKSKERTIEITYLNDNYDEVTERFDLT